MTGEVHDEPVDSLRQRIDRLRNQIEFDKFGNDPHVLDLHRELKAALQLPDFAAHQQTRLAGLLDDLRFSGGLHRNRSHVMFTNDLADWLEGYRNVLADVTDKQSAGLARIEAQLQDIRTAAGFLKDERDELLAQRTAVRAFFGTGETDA